MTPTPEGERGFPAGFLWGTATSAYQIEGGVDLDERGASIWDTFCAVPGNIAGGEDGAIACDHRRRWREDVELMSRLGYGAYRFSVSWPRVQPAGVGDVSESGLDFYDRLVDALLEKRIAPVVTLYHWDLPQSLEDSGGWTSREVVQRFADYAGLVAARLGDRVSRWSTLNEPWCSAMLGYAAGVHAPGRVDPAAAVAASHHLLLAHGLAVEALRAGLGGDSEIGITLNLFPVVAASEGDADADAARRVDGVANRLWTDALLHGHYPDDVLADFSTVSDLSHVRDGDLEQIAWPIDFVGVNYYRRYHVRHETDGSKAPPWCTWPGSPDVRLCRPPDLPVTSMRWTIEPSGLTDVLTRLHRERPGLATYVHENGAAFEDRKIEGVVEDDDRIAFLDAHLKACRAALDEDVDVRGFFVWTLMDNFEWAEGYRRRFGMVAVVPGSLERVPKKSAGWYADVIRHGGPRADGDVR